MIGRAHAKLGHESAGPRDSTAVVAAGVAVDGLSASSGTFALGPISFSCPLGSVTALIGPNGAGKTTLLRCLTGLQSATSGSAHVLGRVVSEGSMPARMAAMIEEPRFLPWMSGRDNLRLACAGRKEWLDRVDRLTEEVGLSGRGDDAVSRYSQGMRQRLGIARVLLGAPLVLALDEPTNGLDPRGIYWARSLVRDLAAKGAAVIVTSHLLHEIQAVADDVLLIYGGQVLAQGPVATVAAGASSLEELYLRLVPER